MGAESEKLVEAHARTILDGANAKPDEIAAASFAQEVMNHWQSKVSAEHFSAVSNRLVELSRTKGDKLPTLELVDDELRVKDFKDHSIGKMSCNAVQDFLANNNEQVFADYKGKLSHDDYEDFLAGSSKILTQVSNGKYEMVTYDSSDKDARPDSFASIATNEVATKTSSGQQQSKPHSLDTMPSVLANSEAGADLAWREFFDKP